MQIPNSLIGSLYIFHIIHPQKQKQSIQPFFFQGEHSKKLSNQENVLDLINTISAADITKYHITVKTTMVIKQHFIKYKIPITFSKYLILAPQDVNTEVCEQLFSWLSKYSHMTKHMNRWRFLFLMLYVLDNHNLNSNKVSNNFMRYFTRGFQ